MNFQTDVIEKSYTRPVLVDFWAPWCGPCRVLGPVIEQLAEEEADKWELVKVNTEEEQELAYQYGIRSIPNVKLFHKGEPIAEFAGALSKVQIKKWLEDYLPDEGKELLLNMMQQLEADSVNAEVLQSLELALQQQPDFSELRIALAKYQLFRAPDTAKELVGHLKGSDPLKDQATDIEVLSQLLTEDFSDGAPIEQQLNLAKEAFKAKDFEQTAKALIQAVTIDKKHKNELPRKASIALFRWLGNDNEITKNYRWRFDMALY